MYNLINYNFRFQWSIFNSSISNEIRGKDGTQRFYLFRRRYQICYVSPENLWASLGPNISRLQDHMLWLQLLHHHMHLQAWWERKHVTKTFLHTSTLMIWIGEWNIQKKLTKINCWKHVLCGYFSVSMQHRQLNIISIWKNFEINVIRPDQQMQGKEPHMHIYVKYRPCLPFLFWFWFQVLLSQRWAS